MLEDSFKYLQISPNSNDILEDFKITWARERISLNIPKTKNIMEEFFWASPGRTTPEVGKNEGLSHKSKKTSRKAKKPNKPKKPKISSLGLGLGWPMVRIFGFFVFFAFPLVFFAFVKVENPRSREKWRPEPQKKKSHQKEKAKKPNKPKKPKISSLGLGLGWPMVRIFGFFGFFVFFAFPKVFLLLWLRPFLLLSFPLGWICYNTPHYSRVRHSTGPGLAQPSVTSVIQNDVLVKLNTFLLEYWDAKKHL